MRYYLKTNYYLRLFKFGIPADKNFYLQERRINFNSWFSGFIKLFYILKYSTDFFIFLPCYLKLALGCGGSGFSQNLPALNVFDFWVDGFFSNSRTIRWRLLLLKEQYLCTFLNMQNIVINLTSTSNITLQASQVGAVTVCLNNQLYSNLLIKTDFSFNIKEGRTTLDLLLYLISFFFSIKFRKLSRWYY